LVSIDSFHYFAGKAGFFQNKILPFMKDKSVILIGIPGLKNKYTGRANELLSNWLGDEAHLFKSSNHWKKIIGNHDKIETVETWEMACFDKAWNEWLTSAHEFARGDKQHFETIIKPYTCFVGIYVKLK
ncbi:MAG: SAM-dependent methyltransferase, partial [Ruminococcus sp.]|nr:SAM-dependent methyltransferase [Ruminococcus sp.]